MQLLVSNFVLKMFFVCSGKSVFFLNCILRLVCIVSVCEGFLWHACSCLVKDL